jgi:hypothetical protein
MIRRGSLALFFAALAVFLATAADLPDRWRSFHYSRPLTSATPQLGGYGELRLPWEIFAHCSENCADLRVIDPGGSEVPYQLITEHAVIHAESRNASIVENSFVPGKYTQVVGDLGQDTFTFDRVRLETVEPDFIVWAEVALSDDAKTWRVVEPRAPIARFRKRSVDGTQTIPFQGVSSRYVRVRVFATERQFVVTGLSVLYEESHPAEFAEVPATFTATHSGDNAETAWAANLPASRVPVSRLTILVDTPEFYRAVRISASEDGKAWSYRGSGAIYRYYRNGHLYQSLTVDFPEWSNSNNLRVAVFNGDDRPLSNVRMRLFAVPRKLLFWVPAGGGDKLLYGNDRVSVPQYDLGHYASFGSPERPYLALSVGPEEVTTNYTDPRPFSERHPSVLWIALGIAIVLIGLTALQTLRTPSPSSPNDPS